MYGPPPPAYDQPRYSTDQLGYPYSPSAPAHVFHNINHTINPTQTQARYSTDGHPSPTPAIPSVLYSPSPVYSGQFPAIVRFPGSAAGRDWSTGLCHCCDDPATCFITCICPCITFGQIADIVSEGSKPCTSSGMAYGLLCLTGCASMYSCFYRSKLRAQYDLPEEPCADCLVHFCCEICALCQEHRELKNRGLDMGIGWEANMDRKKRGLTTIPPQVPSGMTR